MAKRRAKYAKSISWRMDYDYLKSLTPEERAWLERFNEEYYDAQFKGPVTDGTVNTRRSAYRRKNAANRDLSSIGNANQSLDPSTILEQNQSATEPNYETSPVDEELETDTLEYKTWRKWFRSQNDEKMKRPK